MGKHILLPAFTVAEWGGLHEYVVGAIGSLIRDGHRVTAAVSSGLVAERSADAGADVIVVDWDDWLKPAAKLRLRDDFDLIFAQPFKSREMAVNISEATGVPVVTMFHGFNHDYAYTWEEKMAGFVVTTSQIGDMLADLCRVKRERIDIAPNGVAMDRFELGILDLDQKLHNNRGSIVLASRIDHDKRSQIDALKILITHLNKVKPEIQWDVNVLGDGKERVRVEDEMRAFCSRFSGFSFTMHGWVEPNEVMLHMREAVFTISAGRGAMQSLAVGTPCLAAGARGIGGFQVGSNLDVGLWSNFADYPMIGRDINPVETDVDYLLVSSNYSLAQIDARDLIRDNRSQESADRSLVAALSRYW